MPNTELVKKNTDMAVTSSLPKVPNTFKNTEKSVCENCQLTLQGPFCGQCGQKAESTLKYFWIVILHLLDDIFSFDSRAARTIFPLVTRPAFLTNEYFSGRRVHYVPPLRLYLFISIVFFITLNFFVTTENSHLFKVQSKQDIIEEINEHVELLNENQVITKNKNKNKIVNDEQLKVSNDLAKFSTYLIDIKKDETLETNKKLVSITTNLIELELRKIDHPNSFTEKNKEHYELLSSKIVKLKNGEDVEIGSKSKPVIISNNEDGTLAFDFLAEETNKKLTLFANDLAKKAEKSFNSDSTPLVKEVIGKLPQLMFILLPLFAVLLKVMFLFSKRLYMEHLTVALHSHSFIFFTILLLELLDMFYDYCEIDLPSFTGIINFAIKGLLIWIPIYLFMMQKRVYKQGYILTFIKFFFIGNAYILLIVFTGVIAFIWGLTDI